MKSDDVNETLPLGETGATDDAATSPSGVRISGATPVGASAEVPADTESNVESAPVVELPHWADPPTGQLNVVGDTDAVSGPTWREDAADWEQDSLAFEASMLADDSASVTETEEEKVERQPWDFDTEVASTTTSATDASSFSADAYESIPTEEELFSTLGALSAAAVSTTDEAEAVATERPVRRGRKLRSLSERGATDAEATETPSEPLAAPTKPVRRRRPDLPALPAHALAQGSQQRNIALAVAVGFGLGMVLLAALNLGNVISGIAVGVVALAGVFEGFGMFRMVGYRPATFVTGLVTALMLWGSYNYGPQAIPAMLLVAVVGIFAWFFLKVDVDDPITGIGTSLIVFCWVGVCGAYGELILNPVLFTSRHGVAVLFGIVAAVVANDTAALFTGRRLGQHPMAPGISPNKTWEGLLGGTLGSFVVCLAVVALVHPWDFGSALWLALVTSVVAPIGDLAQSAIKRQLGLKDSGSSIPGHGGILDRVDGMLFMLPVGYFLVRALGFA